MKEDKCYIWFENPKEEKTISGTVVGGIVIYDSKYMRT
jgi:hypothetical protein